VIALLSATQTSPVSSWGTFHVAYALVAVIYIGYALSLWTRGRRCRREIESAKPSSTGG
jgi:type VI protein secretion system component VasF